MTNSNHNFKSAILFEDECAVLKTNEEDGLVYKISIKVTAR